MIHDYSKIIPFPRRQRASNCSNPLTAALASRAKTMVLRLGMAQHVVAAKLGVNPARVSEVIHGHKFKDVPFASLDEVTNGEIGQ
jgi:predicted transcriptional regulator